MQSPSYKMGSGASGELLDLVIAKLSLCLQSLNKLEGFYTSSLMFFFYDINEIYYDLNTCLSEIEHVIFIHCKI